MKGEATDGATGLETVFSRSAAFFSHRELGFLLLITLVLILAYGLSISKLSFYGDDWIYIYNYHIAGPGSFSLFTQWDRPFSAWIYILTTAAFGESPIGYHLYVLVMRWLSAVLFWSVLSKTFGQRRTVDIAALLFAVYPGFQQQPIAVEYVMHFTSLVLVLLSLRLMQIAYFLPWKKAIPLYLLSIAAGLAAMFTCEYFIGLELTRPLFLYYTIHNSSNERSGFHSRKTDILSFIPYIAATAFFFFWRIFIFSFQTYQPKLLNALKENPVNGFLLLTRKVIEDLITVFIRAYRLIFTRPANISTTAALAILMIAVMSVFFFFLLHRSDGGSESRGMLVLGCALLMLSGIPFWGTFLDVSVSFPWDRSTLSFSPGAAVILAVLLTAAFRPLFFCAAAAILTALCVLFHVQNARVYLAESAKMNDYFWQLAWRAPGLEKGTILASDVIPLDRTSDNDLSPIVNWQYAPENRGLSYDYKYFDLDLREEAYYADQKVTVPVDHTYRTHSFSSATDKTLGIFYKKNGCLQVIDKLNRNYPGLPDSLAHISSLSNPELILTKPDSAALPPQAIGPEPEHNYCYYFQKTALAQQTGDSDTAYTYALEALEKDLHPVYAPDMAPLVMAFLASGDYESAESMFTASPTSREDEEYLCSYWKNGLNSSANDQDLEEFYKRHGCL